MHFHALQLVCLRLSPTLRHCTLHGLKGSIRPSSHQPELAPPRPISRSLVATIRAARGPGRGHPSLWSYFCSALLLTTQTSSVMHKKTRTKVRGSTTQPTQSSQTPWDNAADSALQHLLAVDRDRLLLQLWC